MSLDARHVTVDDSAAVQLDTSAVVGRDRTLILRNTGGNSAFLGGPGVTTGSGLTLPDGETLTLTLRSFDHLYAIAAALASTVVEVMELKDHDIDPDNPE